jgi:hypothetical protein
MTTTINQGLYEESSVQNHRLGELFINEKGNKYRYVKAGGSALVAGELLQEPAEVTNFRSMVCAETAAIGATSILVTLGGTAVTANLFDEGVLIVESSTGIGQMFNIVSHTVQTSTTGTVRFYLDRPLLVGVTVTSSQITVRKNPYKGVIEYPVTTQTGGAVGFALYAMQASYFGWIQSGGDAVVLWDTGTNSANGASAIAPSAAVAGSVAPVLDAVGSIVLGYSREVVSVDSTVGLAHVTID